MMLIFYIKGVPHPCCKKNHWFASTGSSGKVEMCFFVMSTRRVETTIIRGQNM